MTHQSVNIPARIALGALVLIVTGYTAIGLVLIYTEYVI